MVSTRQGTSGLLLGTTQARQARTTDCRCATGKRYYAILDTRFSAYRGGRDDQSATDHGSGIPVPAIPIPSSGRYRFPCEWGNELAGPANWLEVRSELLAYSVQQGTMASGNRTGYRLPVRYCRRTRCRCHPWKGKWCVHHFLEQGFLYQEERRG